MGWPLRASFSSNLPLQFLLSSDCRICTHKGDILKSKSSLTLSCDYFMINTDIRKVIGD